MLVEDDEEDYLLTRELLAEARETKFVLEWASSYEEGKKAILNNGYDAILMDYQLGPDSGLELTREVNALGCRIPIILLTGRGNYELDILAMQTGVTDYLSKSEATASSLERTIRYAILQRQNEEELRAAKADLETRVQERTSELSSKNLALEAEIAERTRIEKELAEMQRRLLDRAENERIQLARDLHDGPMQELYALVFQVDSLVEQIEAGNKTEAVEALKSQLLEVIQSLRTISRELRPPALAPYGLEKAIRSHVEGLRRGHPDLHIELDLDPDGQALPEPVRMALFRIYQTSITNVIRHANASRAVVRLKLEKTRVCLEVEDNGRGFDLPKRWITLARQGHMGLVGAQERAEAAGGKLVVKTAPGKGTLVRVTVPH